MHITPSLLSFLENNTIQFQYFEHPATATVEESDKIVKDIPGLHSKNLFFVDRDENYYLVCVEAHERLPINQFGRSIGARKLTFGSPEKMQELLGLSPGNVSLFGLIHDKSKHIRVYMSQTLREAELVGRHPNRNDATLVIDHATLEHYLSLLGYEVVVFDLHNIGEFYQFGV